MKQPIIFAIDDDLQVLSAVLRDLKREFRKQYRIVGTESARDGLESLQAFKKQGDQVALFISDQRMPEMLGVEFLAKAREVYPRARKVLLTAYSDTDAAIKAINDVQLDYYLMKPWDPPEERLYPVVTDQLEEWGAANKDSMHSIRLIGYQYSPKSHKIKDFLSGNLIPYKWFDVESNTEANEVMLLHGISTKNLPVIIFDDGQVLPADDLKSIAERLGLRLSATGKLYDVAIVGAGPAGLAAAVYGGSEGLRTLLIEQRAPGGQAGTSSRIENYLGFPAGLSGAELSRRAIAQANKFGIEFLMPQAVSTLSFKDDYKVLELANGTTVHAKAVVLTPGVSYRTLDAPGVADFTGAGVYYGAATTEATSCQNKDVYIVGGGNSAGQGAIYLSNFAKKVYIMLRRDNLGDTMSSYLIDQIGAINNIEVLTHVEVASASGDGNLQHIDILHNITHKVETREAGALFVFIGAKPSTDWMPPVLLRDERNFLLSGRDLMNHPEFQKLWTRSRDPFLLETSVPGVFVAGDVRAGAMNRVASAVGEGAMSISFVHRYLAES